MVTLDDLCSPAYRAQLNQMFEKGAWSGGGKKYVNEIVKLCTKCDAKSVLDYGCGTVDLAALLPAVNGRVLRVQSFDPGVPGRDGLPEPADVVVCVDVLEHVEPDKVGTVLRHIHALTVKCALLMIATRPAEKRLPDGRNAHLTIDSAGWWIHQLRGIGGWKGKIIDNDEQGIHMWWRKTNTTNQLTLS